MKKLLVFFFIVFSFSAIAQVPEPEIYSLKAIGGNNITQVGKFALGTPDGGFVIMINTNANPGSGNTDSFCAMSGQRHIFVKYNSDATAVDWIKCYEINGDTTLDYLFPQSDGGVVLGGTCTAGGYYICKHDALGNIVWSHEYSKGTSLGLRSMITTSDGGYIMGGGSFYIDSNVYTHYGSWMDADMFIIKLDSNGNKQWTKVVGGTSDDGLFSVIQGLDNSYYVLGSVLSNDYDCTGNHGGTEGYLARLDSNGSLVWHRDLGGTNGDGLSAAVATNNGLLVAGTTASHDGDVTDHKSGIANFWLVNVDSSGNILWDSCYGGSGDCYPNNICKAKDGSIWMAGVSSAKTGEVDSSYGGQDAWFVHTDSMGKFIDAKVLGSSDYDGGMMVWPLSNGHILGGGYCQRGDGAFASITSYGGSDGFLVDFGQFIEGVLEVVYPETKIFPNPASDVVHIVSSKTGRFYIAVNDVVGRNVYKSDFEHEITLNTAAWQKGIYLVMIRDESGKREVRMLTIQ
jgi:hypothetical protein